MFLVQDDRDRVYAGWSRSGFEGALVQYVLQFLCVRPYIPDASQQ